MLQVLYKSNLRRTLFRNPGPQSSASPFARSGTILVGFDLLICKLFAGLHTD